VNACDVSLPAWSAELLDEVERAGDDVPTCVRIAGAYGARFPQPGRGATAQRWALLAEIAARDLTPARVLEAHLDALAILDEAGADAPAGAWGVFAAEAPDVHVEAVRCDDGAAVTLHGTKPWCSIAASLDHALVTARVDGERRLVAVHLRDPSVSVDGATGWVARGLRNVVSVPVHFDGTPARLIGDADWYLTRPGFAWGGIGVAACWYGAALSLASSLARAAAKRGGELALLSMGAVDATLHAAGVSLRSAADDIDAGRASQDDGTVLALRVRTVVADAVERTLTQVAHTLGPAPLAFDETFARRVADLSIYVRQHHAERDLAALGAAVVHGGTA
jgi:hypothetical protein